jgi:hypothetical protein
MYLEQNNSKLLFSVRFSREKGRNYQREHSQPEGAARASGIAS